MEVHDFGGRHSVHSIAQLEQLLGTRFKDQLNEFSLCADFAVMARLVQDKPMHDGARVWFRSVRQKR